MTSVWRPFSARRLARGLTALAALLALATPAAGQFVSHGTLAGVVRDAAGRPVADAEVRAADRASGAVRTALTDRAGAFRFELLGVARYDLRVEALGYRPVVLVAVPVRAERTPALRIELRAAAPPVVAVDTIVVEAVQAEPGRWMGDRGYAELAGGRRLAIDAASLSTVADEASVEGLPWRFADVMVDGMRVGSAAAPTSLGNATTALAAPARALAEVSVGGLGTDVEVGGTGVGLAALSLRGGVPPTRGAVFGGTSDLGAALLLGGSLQRDTAQAVFGVDHQRSLVAPAPWFPAGDAGAALVDVARTTYGTDLAPLTKATTRLDERTSAFGRVDWQVGDRYIVSVRGAGSRLVLGDAGVVDPRPATLGARQEATALQGGVSVLARLSPRVRAEVRASADLAEASADAPAIPTTAFAGRGLTVGGDPAERFADERFTPRLTAAIHVALGAHQLKVGGLVASHRLESRGLVGGHGTFRFGDASDFQAGEGAWRGVDAAVGSGAFTMSEKAFFVQDAWRVNEDLSLTLGLRMDGATLPLGDLRTNPEWLAATGLDSRAVAAPGSRVAPRVAFRWTLGERRAWVVTGSAGTYHDLPDRRDVADALALDGGAEVRSALGALGGWPAAPTTAVAAVRGRTVALLGPEFEGPRTRRFTLGVQRAVGGWSAFAQGTYRQTDFLARRRELDLGLGGLDQDGRPLYGTMRRVGTVLASEPGSARRFDGLDGVTAIEATGFSEFAGVTVGIERVRERGLSVGLQYTYSRTRDNLVAGAPSGLVVDAAADAWAEGTADTDAPHRALAALEWSPLASGGLKLGAIYRVRSGTPFTPGFRDGVDANGDGIAGNDPAFIDAARPGMAPLLDAHECLRGSTGRFARRNACVGDLVHRLDLRAAVRLFALRGGPVELVVDAIDVLGAAAALTDRALYLVDRGAPVTTDPASGVTTLPLVVNPNFGATLADRPTDPLFRVGLRIGR